MKRSGLGPGLAQEVGTRMRLVCQKRPAFVKKHGKKIRAEIGAEPSKSIVSPALPPAPAFPHPEP
jgi:hypothetical protein